MTNGGAYYEYAENLEEAGNYLEAAERITEKLPA